MIVATYIYAYCTSVVSSQATQFVHCVSCRFLFQCCTGGSWPWLAMELYEDDKSDYETSSGFHVVKWNRPNQKTRLLNNTSEWAKSSYFGYLTRHYNRRNITSFLNVSSRRSARHHYNTYFPSRKPTRIKSLFFIEKQNEEPYCYLKVTGWSEIIIVIFIIVIHQFLPFSKSQIRNFLSFMHIK